jgi:leucyl aminopeptidase
MNKFETNLKIKRSVKNLIIPILIQNKISLFEKINHFIPIENSKYNSKILIDLQRKIIDNKKLIISILLNFEEIPFNIILVSIPNNNLDEFRIAGAKLLQFLNTNSFNTCNLGYLFNTEYHLAFLEGLILSSYKFDKYKTKYSLDDGTNQKTKSLKKINFNIILPNISIIKQVKNLFIKCQTVFLTRDLVNEPNNKLSSLDFIKIIKLFITKNKLPIKVTIFDTKKLKQLGMNLLVSVGQGSKPEYQSQLLILEYNPSFAKSKKSKSKLSKSKSKSRKLSKSLKNKTHIDYTLIGKGVLFDTGGIHLKRGNGMYEMKSDMAGAAIVASFIVGYAQLKGSKSIVAMVPLAQNNIINNPTIPGDIIQAYNKKTVEIINTDAEGRLLLADALSYAVEKYPSSQIIDFATLTGQQESLSCKLFSNIISKNSKLMSNIVKAGLKINERVVPLPYIEEYKKFITSETADIKNVSTDCKAQIMTSSVFLGQFVKPETVWGHIDIAGPSWKLNSPYTPGEASGVGTRLLFELIQP